MGITASELDALEIIGESKEPISVQAVSRKMNVEPAYAHILCKSLAKNDYIDLIAGRICRITLKGKSEILRRKKQEVTNAQRE